MGARYTIKEETLEDLAGSIRELTHENLNMTPSQMANKIRSLRLGVPIDVSVHLGEDGRWVRPVEYPDLDSIDISDDFDGVYLTYDLRKTPGYGWIGIYVALQSSGNYFVERGHLTDGAFVIDETFTLTNKQYFRQSLDSTNGDVQLWRVRSDTKYITRVAFCTNSATSADSIQNNVQPCVERRGRLNYVTTLESSVTTNASYTSWGTAWLEKDSVIFGGIGKVTSLSSAWSYCYSLQELDLNHVNSTNWVVTSLYNTFNYCYSLRILNLSNIDTSNWAITSLQNTFNWCSSLEELDFSGINTSNWAVTRLDSAFNGCVSLKSIAFTGVDTSNWRVTNLSSTFGSCYSLQYLDFSNIDTSEWAVTNTSSMFSNCWSLERIDITGIDTSNWRITTIASTFNACYSLREIDLSSLDTSEWVVNTVASVFNGCHMLKSIDFSGIDTSNWVVTTVGSMFANCWSLESLDLSGLDVSGWPVTTMASMFISCWSLQEIIFTGWDTSGWAVTSLDSFLYGCRSLREIDLSVFDTSNWTVINIYAMVRDCYSLEEVDLSSWDISNFAITDTRYCFTNDFVLKTAILQESLFSNSSNVNGTFNDCRSLVNVSGFRLFLNHSYSNCIRLTRQSLLNILNALPAVSVTRTLTLGQTNKLKLTAEEIAIATQKGWTVA